MCNFHLSYASNEPHSRHAKCTSHKIKEARLMCEFYFATTATPATLCALNWDAMNRAVRNRDARNRVAGNRGQPFSLTCLLIKTSLRRNLTSTIVFDELVVKGEQAAIRGAVCVITRCAVTLISSNSNDTALATGSAEASQFAIGCMARIAT